MGKAKLIVHDVNISHQRLVELSKLANQAKPFYDYIERIAKKELCDHRSLNDILMSVTKQQIKDIFSACYHDESLLRPPLFDGIGIPYSPNKATFFFLSWMIRDAPAQRLKPLISEMIKKSGKESLSSIDAEIDALSELFFAYRGNVQTFAWEAVREIIIDRLEGSRRSHSGHAQEIVFRTALATALQTFATANCGYGKYDSAEILTKQLKVGGETVDIAIRLKQGENVRNMYFPVKTRETQGGGHAHLFSRDLIAAIASIKEHDENAIIGAFIVAESWNIADLEPIKDKLSKVFYYNTNPNELDGLSDDEQIEINKYIAGILNGMLL